MRKIVVVLALTALAATACGDDDSATTAAPATSTTTTAAATTTTAAATTTAAPATTAAVAEAAVVTIEGFAFGGAVTASVGQEVVVRNLDGAPHTWTSVDEAFDSGTIPGGGEFGFTFDEAGRYPFICMIHPSMSGTITVTE